MLSERISRTGQLWRVRSHRRSRSDESVPSPTESELSPVYTSPKPKLFALLIGINRYDHVQRLRGAVPDIHGVRTYLEGYLKVPQDQIQILTDKAASRRAIIDGFIQLQDDERIKEGDPILIYFSGHGSEILVSENGLETKMQAIVPQDYCAEPGNEVPAILDRTIGALIAKIANKKGDNITLIFDCCHSGSGTRGKKSDDAQTSVNIRSVSIEASIHAEDLDCDIWDSGQRGTSAPSNLFHSTLSSHVLIASCGLSESAIEVNGHGCFSYALLKLLRSVPPDQLRYSDILTQMDAIPNQNPQCEGLNQKRYLFNSQISMLAQTCFNITIQNGNFVLDAGLVTGISEGAEFTVYAISDRTFKKPLGTLVIDTLRSFSADLKLSPGTSYFTLEQPSIALQTKRGQRKDLQLYIPSDDKFWPGHDALLKLLENNYDLQSINFVDQPEDADFELAMQDKDIIFLYRDQRITQHGLTQLYKHVPPIAEELAPVLKCAAHFYWKLNRTNNNPQFNHGAFNNGIQVELYKLLPPKIRNFNDIGGGLVPIGPNLYKDGVMNVVADTDLNIPYGFKLINNTPYDLYPHLFYFDLSDLSIVSYYETPSTAERYTLDVPLPKNGGVLTIGYGTGGAPAQTFYLRPGQKLDVGFLKIFFCTKPVDLSAFSQSSPFEITRSGTQHIKPKEEVWSTMLIPMLQHQSDPCIQTLNNENDIHKKEIDMISEAQSEGTHQLKKKISKEQEQKPVELLSPTKPYKVAQVRTLSDSVSTGTLAKTRQPGFIKWLLSFMYP